MSDTENDSHCTQRCQVLRKVLLFLHRANHRRTIQCNTATADAREHATNRKRGPFPDLDDDFAFVYFLFLQKQSLMYTSVQRCKHCYDERRTNDCRCHTVAVSPPCRHLVDFFVFLIQQTNVCNNSDSSARKGEREKRGHIGTVYKGGAMCDVFFSRQSRPQIYIIYYKYKVYVCICISINIVGMNFNRGWFIDRSSI